MPDRIKIFIFLWNEELKLSEKHEAVAKRSVSTIYIPLCGIWTLYIV